MVSLSEYEKSKEFLVCVDSDGCAMDTMDVKHFNCFGPCMIAEWSLEEWKDEILKRWNEINLYSLTRGINRFKGLSLALSEINERCVKIEGINELVHWTETTLELSGASLKREIEKYPTSPALKKALNWNEAVNEAIVALPEESKMPFKMAKEGLMAAHKVADVAIISSANLDAVLEEWEKHSLLLHTDIVLAQNSGSKAFCIGEMLKKGYPKENVVMCGDAVGDMEAAQKNGVHFFPILVKKEKESWEEFISSGLKKLLNGSFEGEYSEKKKKEFLNNLGAEK